MSTETKQMEAKEYKCLVHKTLPDTWGEIDLNIGVNGDIFKRERPQLFIPTRSIENVLSKCDHFYYYELISVTLLPTEQYNSIVESV